jgi:hypothetical protein
MPINSAKHNQTDTVIKDIEEPTRIINIIRYGPVCIHRFEPSLE